MNRLQKNPAWLMLLFLGATAALFTVIAPQTLSAAALGSIAIQLPQLGILTLAMFVPVISGGLNLAITYIANIGGLLAAVILTQVFHTNRPHNRLIFARHMIGHEVHNDIQSGKMSARNQGFPLLHAVGNIGG